MSDKGMTNTKRCMVSDYPCQH